MRWHAEVYCQYKWLSEQMTSKDKRLKHSFQHFKHDTCIIFVVYNLKVYKVAPCKSFATSRDFSPQIILTKVKILLRLLWPGLVQNRQERPGDANLIRLLQYIGKIKQPSVCKRHLEDLVHSGMVVDCFNVYHHLHKYALLERVI